MQELEFTTIKVKLNDDTSCRAKAFVAITFNHLFKISGLQLMDGEGGYYIQYPTYTRLCGEVKPACYPICEEQQKRILDLVLEKYWEAKDLITSPAPSKTLPNR